MSGARFVIALALGLVAQGFGCTVSIDNGDKTSFVWCGGACCRAVSCRAGVCTSEPVSDEACVGPDAAARDAAAEPSASSGGVEGGAQSIRDAAVDRVSPSLDPVAACLAWLEPYPDQPNCARCRCEGCAEALVACADDAACTANVACQRITGCRGRECNAGGVCDVAPGPLPSPSPTGPEFSAVEECVRQCDGACGGVAEGEPVTASITLTDRLTATRIAGAKICVFGTDDCAVTDGDGRAKLTVPALSRVGFAVTASGYAHVLWGLRTGAIGNAPGVFLVSQDRVDSWRAAAGVADDPTKGAVWFGGAYPEGTRVALSPTAGTTVYHDESGPNLALRETSASGVPKGIIWNVEPLDYDVGFSHPTAACTAADPANWPGATPDTAAVAVEAGVLSLGGHLGQCEEAP